MAKQNFNIEKEDIYWQSNRLTIKLKKFREQIGANKKILNAVLVFENVSSENDSSIEIEVKGKCGCNAEKEKLIDIITLDKEAKNVSINVTHEMDCILKNSELNLVLTFLGGVFKLNNVSIEVEHIPLQITYENNAYLEIVAKQIGEGTVNLATGILNFKMPWLNYASWLETSRDIIIEDAEGGKKIFNTHCGRGWKLDAARYLVQRECSNSCDQTVFTYIDGEGNYHEFLENYYYIQNKNKVYIKKEEVAVDLNGNLTYQGTDKKVLIERKSTSGLVLETDYTQFKNGEYLEMRTEEQIEVEEKIAAYNSQLKSYVIINKNGDTIRSKVTSQEDITEKSFENFYKNINADYLLLTETEALQFRSLLLQQSISIDDVGETTILVSGYPFEKEYEKTLVNLQKELRDLKESYTKTEHTILRYQNDLDNIDLKIIKEKYGLDVNKKLEEVDWDKFDYAKLTQLDIDKGKEKLVENKKELKELSEKISALEEKINDYLVLNQGRIVNGQISSLIEQSEKNKKDIVKYFKQYLGYKNQLENLREQMPVNFITDGDTVMGFNEKGLLVVTIDAYENQTAIIYKGDKIVAIKDSDNNETIFEYNRSDLLCKITDTHGKITEFEYSLTSGWSDRFHKIKTNQEEIEFSYRTITDGSPFGSPYLSSIKYCGLNCVEFKCDNFYRVIEIKDCTKYYSVSDGNVDARSYILNTKLSTTIAYCGANTTTLKEENKVATTYIFDQYGHPTAIVEGKYEDPGESTKALSMEYCDEQQSYSVTEDYSEDNILKECCSDDSLKTGSSVRQRIYHLDSIPKGKTDFVFSCWARADSAYIKAAKYKDLKSNQNVRKFELRAVVVYDDGDIDIYSASFDWLNNDWQFLALPVEIRKPLKQGDPLPANLPVATSGGISLYIDYSLNTGEIEADCVSFRPGKWQYSTFDDGGRKLIDEDSESNSKTNYYYDDKDRIIKQVVTDSKGRTFETTFEYNNQGKLVRSCGYSGLVKETVYDEKGREIKNIIYNLDDTTSKLYTESKRDEKGNITADVDESGEYDCKNYVYEDNTSTVVKDGKGNKTSFGYKDENFVSISGNADGEEVTNTMHYTAGLLTKVSNGDTDYNFTYDNTERIKSIDIGGKNYATMTYYKMQRKDCTSFDNGNSKTVCFNEYDNKSSQTWIADGYMENIEYTYDDVQNLTGVEVDIGSKKSYTIAYTRKNGKVVEEVRDGNYPLIKKYGCNANGVFEDSEDSENKEDVQSLFYRVGVQSLFYKYETDNTPDKRNSKVTLPFNVEQKFAYDGLGRTKEIALGKNLVKDIYYQKFGDHATNRVSTVWYGVKGIRRDSLKYTYDKAGNIASISENGVVIAKYTYDGLNRLICEVNSEFGEIKYEYDHAGNIVCKIVNGERYNYYYSQSGWRDQLLSFNDEIHQRCVYDEIGNPTIYRGRTLNWRGRRLVSYANGDKRATYTYDGYSVRTSKTVTGVRTVTGSTQSTTKYIYDGNTLVAEQRIIKQINSAEDKIEWIYYLYGVDGIAGFRYNGTTYLYRKNIQGDITHIYTADGWLVARYAYDAFGNTKILPENDAKDLSSIANINPFRYRGYYYDTETGLYYLISRYYDPETGRFISADSIEYLDPETLGGLNLYAYCGNNPVMAVDPEGKAWWDWAISGLQLLVGVALCFVPGTQGIGATLIVGGTLGLIANAVSPAIGQVIGGASSIANGWGALSTGISILGLGIPGMIGGIALILVGGATMAFGANEIVAGISGTNYIQKWTGMSDAEYGWAYIGLNLASSIGQIAGVKYRQIKTRSAIYNSDGSVKQYRYYRRNGNKLYDIDFNHPAYGNPNIKFPHYHGWTNAGIRAKEHQSYIQLIIWLLFGGR